MVNSQIETIVLGGGCFWCTEAAFQQIKGVAEVFSGYAGGTQPNPTYNQVVSGLTGHAEVVQVSFDIKIISLAQILEIFWVIHNPTTLNRQGSDVGTQYRSMIMYSNAAQQQVAAASIQEIAQLWSDPIVTELRPLERFYPAESYHQNFFASNPQHAYCQVVINPKLQKLRQSFAAKLRD